MYLKRFLSMYYVWNVALISAYPRYIRPYLNSQIVDVRGPTGSFTVEVQIWFSLGMLLLAKFVNSATIDGFLNFVFTWYKWIVFALLLLSNYRGAVFFVALTMGGTFLIPDPKFTGPQKIEFLNPMSYKDRVLLAHKHRKQSPDAKCRWLVEFYTTWAPPCQEIAPVYADLSLSYGSEHLRFAKFDIGRYPGLAYDLHISTDAMRHQLPTFILFENGKELTRMPRVTDVKGGEHTVVQVTGGVSRKNLETVFNLATLSSTPLK
eukprot:TRINITY_DN8703_c0_g1_i1.p1 TRINITY_DN8703_c0_g1~~TRINITY_DN8703_c0_g1_i1.p1  ORF type:complete len:263 (-),score=39.73 TRINITY_DN8703_c0_g1_i1:3-791(-)